MIPPGESNNSPRMVAQGPRFLSRLSAVYSIRRVKPVHRSVGPDHKAVSAGGDADDEFALADHGNIACSRAVFSSCSGTKDHSSVVSVMAMLRQLRWMDENREKSEDRAYHAGDADDEAQEPTSP